MLSSVLSMPGALLKSVPCIATAWTGLREPCQLAMCTEPRRLRASASMAWLAEKLQGGSNLQSLSSRRAASRAKQDHFSFFFVKNVMVLFLLHVCYIPRLSKHMIDSNVLRFAPGRAAATDALAFRW